MIRAVAIADQVPQTDWTTLIRSNAMALIAEQRARAVPSSRANACGGSATSALPEGQPARTAAVQPPEPEITCKRCGEDKPADEMVLSYRNGPAQPTRVCKVCHNARTRRREHGALVIPLRRDNEQVEVDPSPARAMTALLAHARREDPDLAFSDAWEKALQAVLEALRRENRDEWRIALVSMVDAWQAGYERRQTSQTRMSVDLLQDRDQGAGSVVQLA